MSNLSAILDDARALLEPILRHPLLVVELGLLGAILCGAGRAVGAPMLFWDKKIGHQFLAGLSAALFVSQAFFVAYLLRPDGGRDHPLALERLLLEGAFFFLGTVFTVMGIRHLSGRRQARRNGGGVQRSLLVPGVSKVENGQPAPSTGATFRPWPFAAGWIASMSAVFAVERNAWPVVDTRLCLVAFLFLAAVAFFTLRRRAPPAVAICTLLSVVAAAYGGLLWLTGSPGLGLLALLGLLWFAGARLYKLRIPSFAGGSITAYENPLPYPPPEESARAGDVSERSLLPYDAGLQRRAEAGPVPLVVVCVSGGGIRAAAWAAAILARLGAIPNFVGATRLVTGASGGSLGAACWVAQLAASDGREARIDWRSLVDAVGADSLTATLRRLVFHDLPMAFLPFVNRSDRGRAIEAAWCENTRRIFPEMDLSRPVCSLLRLEADGRLPSLVLSPMIVEDGRRLLVGNLDLRGVTDNHVLWLSSQKTGDIPVTGIASRSAYHISDLVRGGAHIPLSTAARLAASFPFVSPAVVLPTRPRRRAVDAGYFDNYGLDLASAWLRHLVSENGPSTRKLVSRVLVVQIRDNVSNLSVNPESDQRKEALRDRRAANPSALARGLEGLTSPPQGFLAARESVMLFRNDNQLAAVSQLYRAVFECERALSTTVFEFSGEASLSWRLTNEELDGIKSQAGSSGIDDKLAAIEKWLAVP